MVLAILTLIYMITMQVLTTKGYGYDDPTILSLIKLYIVNIIFSCEFLTLQMLVKRLFWQSFKYFTLKDPVRALYQTDVPFDSRVKGYS